MYHYTTSVLLLTIVCMQGCLLKSYTVNCEELQNDTTISDYRNEMAILLEQNLMNINKTIKRVIPIMFIQPKLLNGTCSNSQEDFPNFFTPEQRKSGAILMSFIIGIYCFTLLAIICDNYFLPCVEQICETLNLSQDVAAATFMAMATSAPELFVNIIGTFITESDIGLGTVVGSSMFNTLGVAALGSLAASTPIQVDWWPVTRDSIIYLVSISLLVIVTWDGMIFWYEGLVLFLAYFFYFAIMFNNSRISLLFRRLVSKCAPKRNISIEELTFSETSEASINIYYIETVSQLKEEDKTDTNKNVEPKRSSISKSVICQIEDNMNCPELKELKKINDTEDSEQSTIFKWPTGKWHQKTLFFYTWPIKFLLFCTIPDPRTRPKLFPLTFIVCILYIGGNSYIVSWMITIIGGTFGISDSVLGLTLLAGGGCLPEALSIIIMSRKGEGSMGVSNALGANTMNILLSLGLPWFIKTLLLDEDSGGAIIVVTSGSMEYTIVGLMLVAIALFVILYFNKFQLKRRTGIILILVYVVFVSAAIVSEMLFAKTQPC